MRLITIGAGNLHLYNTDWMKIQRDYVLKNDYSEMWSFYAKEKIGKTMANTQRFVPEVKIPFIL